MASLLLELYSFDGIGTTLKGLNDNSRSFFHEISDCGVRVFSRKSPGVLPSGDHPINQVRESLLYRIKAIVYHIEILINQRKAINEQIGKEFSNNTANPVSIENLIIHQYYFFDDILFNLLSMFDYVSAMIGFMFENKYYKWNSLVRSARNNNTAIGNKVFAKDIIELHSDWVDALIEIRSDLIHRRPKFGEETIGSGGYKKNIPDFTIIKVNTRLNKLVQKISGERNPIDVIDCSILLGNHSFTSCRDLFEKIK